MIGHYGFDFYPEKCVQCHACEVACKVLNQVERGVAWRKVMTFWHGSFPLVSANNVSFSCQHCGNPPCEAACPQGAISKRAEDGIVMIDQRKCIGCHLCLIACPFGIPQFGSNGKMQKCNLCVDLITSGKEPACVATCPSGALRFGTLQELSEEAIKRYTQKIADRTLDQSSAPSRQVP
jgi:anaerobic dimethyl sulfoxide reductase subunit B